MKNRDPYSDAIAVYAVDVVGVTIFLKCFFWCGGYFFLANYIPKEQANALCGQLATISIFAYLFLMCDSRKSLYFWLKSLFS
ncbi:MAG: hypothetical protein Athens071425_69 [Parcubacteria group bacterium Athens0714_25]|nr:MAG: hypothetical protein Athens071425_69 [Parcubacteria group bacterium Athens0714_25]